MHVGDVIHYTMYGGSKDPWLATTISAAGDN